MHCIPIPHFLAVYHLNVSTSRENSLHIALQDHLKLCRGRSRHSSRPNSPGNVVEEKCRSHRHPYGRPPGRWCPPTESWK